MNTGKSRNNSALYSLLLGMLVFCHSGCSAEVGNDILGIYGEPAEWTDGLPLVPQKAFYKDVFLDAGIGLTSRKFLYAARYLNLSTEGISFSRSNATMEDIALQNSIIAGDESDTNGRLLYPDGQPRYRLLFVNGGSSTTHGNSLDEEARANMKSFVQNGGCYVGTCAGAFFASNGYDSHTDYPYYLSIWPYMLKHTGISNSSTGMFIEQDSPLLDYYDLGGDYYVSEIRHNGGCYPPEVPEGTKVLARYDCPDRANVHQQPSVWAYRSAVGAGRVVMVGSHPEEVSTGERRDLTAAMMRYAMDGVGLTTLKSVLRNGEVRVMDKTTEDNDPPFTRIGDLQCHHFVVNIPEEAYDITITTESDIDCDLQLSVCHRTYAYPEDADYVSETKGRYQQLSFLTLDPGIWYVCVKCLTSVEASETDYGQSYTDTAGVLNGIPYRIQASWTELPARIAKAKNGRKGHPDGSSRPHIYGIDGKIYSQSSTRGLYVKEGKLQIPSHTK